jgi:hypothetical protein
MSVALRATSVAILWFLAVVMIILGGVAVALAETSSQSVAGLLIVVLSLVPLVAGVNINNYHHHV